MNLRLSGLLLVTLLLAACGGQPARVSDGDASVGTKAPRKSAVAQKRGGGYYKDDGPGDDIPDNLDDLPDAEPRLEPLHRFANRPYVVLGKSYTPDTALRPLRQRGIGSWYGKKFHGQNTSIGEPYDMFAMTAAHPTLAIPSYVRVTSVASGKSVVVRVTDRGPFHADRIIDLSYAAAYRLGYINNGSTEVEVETIVPDASGTTLTYAQVKPPTPQPAAPVAQNPAPEAAAAPDEIAVLAAKLASAEETPPPTPLQKEAQKELQKGVFLQLGAFASADNAESLRLHLLRELDWLTEAIEVNGAGGVHRVHLGPYASRADAEKVAERIRLALGYKPTFVTR
ncbi:MAG: septal ring lytic transglycosylase RlpA family protein [Propionivibrio sp.]|uniref:septal ring lytic transglycosylase RlpA family protein n=1 Tax=Propionivibrio sp. TaxID=2212460 RepID=UPI001B5B4393|nr:septal ring lytic transglycosylase RlpA family protein [Propionivibrio sp.]MBP7203255.1 septal ring lytic transglycosylase RlpA family protein [Propionivibrio sp.]